MRKLLRLIRSGFRITYDVTTKLYCVHKYHYLGNVYDTTIQNAIRTIIYGNPLSNLRLLLLIVIIDYRKFLNL